MGRIFAMTEKNLQTYDILVQVEKDGLKQVRAAELLGVSERHFRRLLKAYREKGAEALVSKKAGNPSNNRTKEPIKQKVIQLLISRYTECGPTFAAYKLRTQENISLSKETVRKIMIEEGLWEPKRKVRIKVHQRRNRRKAEGELLQMDGSPHAWFEERGPKCTLLASIDDATSRLQHLQFVQSESTANYLSFLKEGIRKTGKPLAYYTDRLNVFRVNNNKEGYQGRGLTQVGRALKELDIELICANSPQAKGRIERVFKTLQDRLVKELRLKGISDIEEANCYLRNYIREHNTLFSIEPLEEKSVYRFCSIEELEKALCVKESRKLTKNLELSYEGRVLQIKSEDHKHRLKGALVTVVKDLQGNITIDYQGKELEYKELWVRDTQGQIKNRKEILEAAFSP